MFSKALNENMTVLAVEGSFASVIGGAPAAAVVFARQVDARTAADPRVTALEAAVAATTPPEKKAELVSELAEVRASVRPEKLSALAAEFDAIHSIKRAVEALTNSLESEKPVMASRSGSIRSSTPACAATARALASNGSPCQLGQGLRPSER
jgi:hypothetical protein